jgi:hypothetical protein
MPTHLAVARLADESTLTPDGYRHSSRTGNLRLGIVAGAELEGWEKAVARERDIKGVRVISPGILSAGEMTLHGLRSAAAQMGCELLLVYLQVDGSVDNTTDAAALYWTLIGLWTAQGNVYERKTVIQAALLDCRTGMILGTSGGECSMRTAYAAAYEKTARDKLDSQVPGKALEDVQKSSVRMLAQVVAAADRKGLATTRADRE